MRTGPDRAAPPFEFLSVGALTQAAVININASAVAMSVLVVRLISSPSFLVLLIIRQQESNVKRGDN
jgi:hypothetical protein